ncbi:hypothetical protein SLEP1_g14953 [Rubroshorea leprosula]|uniref:Uncharacterized protein n=1 Tax=Rubroshorea leprosula TaxID=152421 RepID=A0AAV5IUP0_9ROSI|nr:hypothetical protein SLEP1_g14953 [Rubroshorea leprosula]
MNPARGFVAMNTARRNIICQKIKAGEPDARSAPFHATKSKMMRTVNDSVETVNAAATAIISAESRVQPAVVQVNMTVHEC